MSIEVLLVPLGIAAIVALREALSTAPQDDFVVTRVTDEAIVVDALARLGAEVSNRSEGEVTATSRWGRVTFRRGEQTFVARVDDYPAMTAEMLSEFDASVGWVVQQRTARIAIERAEQLGFRLIEQQEDDGTLNYVFEEA